MFAQRFSNVWLWTDWPDRGSHLDPSVDRFGNFMPAHDLDAVGVVLSFIFTGRKGLIDPSTAVGQIVHKCMDSDLSKRYPNAMAVIAILEKLPTPSS